MRGLFSDVIADHVMGYVLCFARNLHTYIRQQQQGVGSGRRRSGTASRSSRGRLRQRDGPRAPAAGRLHAGRRRRRGASAREICRAGRAFGMRSAASIRNRGGSRACSRRCGRSSGCRELLGQSDFVVIAAPHTPATRRTVPPPQFEQMKRDALLINIGRGAIVVAGRPGRRAGAGEIAGAALDVFEIEPLPPDHPLWRMPNVILTPHVAACSIKIPERHLATLLENVRRFSRGEAPLNAVDKAIYNRG